MATNFTLTPENVQKANIVREESDQPCREVVLLQHDRYGCSKRPLRELRQLQRVHSLDLAKARPGGLRVHSRATY